MCVRVCVPTRERERERNDSFPPQRQWVHEHFALNDLLAGLKSQLLWAAQQVLWATHRKTSTWVITQCVLLKKRQSWSTREKIGGQLSHPEWARVKARQGSQTQLTWGRESVPYLTKKHCQRVLGRKQRLFSFPDDYFAPKRGTDEICPTSHFGRIRIESLEKKSYGNHQVLLLLWSASRN